MNLPRLKDLASKTVATPRAGPLASQLAASRPDVTVTMTGYDESLSTMLAGEANAAALNLQGGIRLARAKYDKFRCRTDPFIWCPWPSPSRAARTPICCRKFDEQIAAMRANDELAAVGGVVAGESARSA